MTYEDDRVALNAEIKDAWIQVERHRLTLLESERLFDYWMAVAESAEEELEELLESHKEEDK